VGDVIRYWPKWDPLWKHEML